MNAKGLMPSTMNAARTRDDSVAIVTPSFARDFTLCSELNESVLRFLPEQTRHYIVVDGRDLELFRSLENRRTIVAAVEDVLPRGYFKLPNSKKWWMSLPALMPARGWLIQQLVKLSMAQYLGESVIVNVDSDVRFMRPVKLDVFAKDGRSRLYRKNGGVTAGMDHVNWHKTVCRLLDVPPDSIPMDDYVGNIISWDRQIALDMRTRIESVTGKPWHVAFTQGRVVSEYLTYGLYVEKLLADQAPPVWIDERPWCHTYWGPGALTEATYPAFVDAMLPDDLAFSIAGYTNTDAQILRLATERAIQRSVVTA